jgi:hypothetical protein
MSRDILSVYSVSIWDVNTVIREKATVNRQQATGKEDTDFLSIIRKHFLYSCLIQKRYSWVSLALYPTYALGSQILLGNLCNLFGVVMKWKLVLKDYLPGGIKEMGNNTFKEAYS